MQVPQRKLPHLSHHKVCRVDQMIKGGQQPSGLEKASARRGHEELHPELLPGVPIPDFVVPKLDFSGFPFQRENVAVSNPQNRIGAMRATAASFQQYHFGNHLISYVAPKPGSGDEIKGPLHKKLPHLALP